MQLFIDTGDIEEIKEVNAWGILDGVTTNPSLVAKTGRLFNDVIKELLSFFPGSVSLEVIATETDAMVEEGHKLAMYGENVVVKLPTTIAGVSACKRLSEEGVKCNLTLCFSVPQALLVAKAGAFYVSPFIGRLDDIGQDGIQLVADIATVYKNYGYKTQILAASIRNLEHVTKAALVGADIATCPIKILKEMYQHDLTDKGLTKFLEDWKASGQKPLI